MIAAFDKTVRPTWLRPGAVVAALGLHLCGVLFLAVPSPALISPDDSLEVTIAQGAPVEEEAPPPPPAPEPPAPEPPPPPPDPTPPPEPEPPPPEPPPVVKREVREAPALPQPPKPKPKPVQPPPEERPPEAPKPGQEQAVDQITQLKATYAGKIHREIEAHRITPPFGHGAVVIAFTIDPAGDVTSASVARSSGLDTLDSLALRMVRAINPGAPPDGAFAGTVRVNFYN